MINRIIYRTYEWATTNPPRNISDTLTLEKSENGITLKEISDYNSNRLEKVYAVSERQFSEIEDLFIKNGIENGIKRALASKTQPPFPTTVGGGSGAVFSAVKEGEELVCDVIFPELSEFINSFKRLRDGCGAPISETGEPFAINGATISVFVPAIESEEPDEGEWKCKACGYAHNTGSFCTECGTKKSDD